MGKSKFDNLSIYKHRIIHRRVFVLGKRILMCNFRNADFLLNVRVIKFKDLHGAKVQVYTMPSS